MDPLIPIYLLCISLQLFSGCVVIACCIEDMIHGYL